MSNYTVLLFFEQGLDKPQANATIRPGDERSLSFYRNLHSGSIVAGCRAGVNMSMNKKRGRRLLARPARHLEGTAKPVSGILAGLRLFVSVVTPMPAARPEPSLPETLRQFFKLLHLLFAEHRSQLLNGI